MVKEKQNKLDQLNPQFEKVEIDLTVLEKEEINTNIKNNIVAQAINTSGGADSFFKNVIDKLFNNEHIELKTEYLNEEENFTGAKLDFISKFGGVPFASDFLNLWERKRVSLKRKSRQEIVMGLWKREEEIRRQEQVEYDKRIGL